MASKTSPTKNFSEQENFYRPNWVETFRKWKAKTMKVKPRWPKKRAKAWGEILAQFNSENPSVIKRDVSQLQGCWRRLNLRPKKEHYLHRREVRKTGGGKAPAFQREETKLVADVISASVNPQEQECDDDAGEELDLRRDKN